MRGASRRYNTSFGWVRQVRKPATPNSSIALDSVEAYEFSPRVVYMSPKLAARMPKATLDQIKFTDDAVKQKALASHYASQVFSSFIETVYIPVVQEGMQRYAQCMRRQAQTKVLFMCLLANEASRLEQEVLVHPFPDVHEQTVHYRN